MPSVQHSVKRFVAESLTLPSAALGKAFFAECPTNKRHSAKRPTLGKASDFGSVEDVEQLLKLDGEAVVGDRYPSGPLEG
jgi:hypothetical protein